MKLFYHEGEYYLVGEDGDVQKPDWYNEDREGSGYTLPKDAILVHEVTETPTGKLWRVEHHWATVISGDNEEQVIDEATSLFLKDYDLEAYGMDFRDSMKISEVKRN